MILLPIVQPLSFNITNFSNTESASPIEYAGVAKTENGTVVLNPLINGGVGRAICVQPLRLKKSSNEDVTDFSTRFSFSINAPNKTNYADGFAFYVAPLALAYQIPPSSGGLRLGLYDDSKPQNSFVAVELTLM